MSEHEITEASANVIATMRRLIDDLNANPTKPRALRAAVFEFRNMADYLARVADEAEAEDSHDE